MLTLCGHLGTRRKTYGGTVRHARWLRSPCFQAVLVIEHPLLVTMVFGGEMDTLCRPSTFEHVLAAMWSFARTSDVFLDDGALLNCRTAPKYPNVCFGLHPICTRLFGVKQTGTCSATNDTLHCGDNACS